MKTEQKIWKGWMSCPSDKVHILHNIHVKITRQVSTDEYEVEVTDAQLDELEQYWPEIFWGLE